MTTQEIKTLSTEEKFKIMEALWADMQTHYESATISPELLALLRHRKDRVDRGEAKLLEWDEVKLAIGRG
jgi:Putative addiction module component